MKEQAVLIFCTVPDNNEAKSIARLLIEKKLAACCSIMSSLVSIFSWDDAIEEANELLLLIKTSQTAWPKLKEKLSKLHPYDEPEIIMLPIADVSDGYRNWVIDQTT